MISHTQKIHSQHTQGPIESHINIYQHHLLSAHSSYLHDIELIAHWYQKFILQRSIIQWLFKNYSSAKVMYLLSRFKKTKPYSLQRKGEGFPTVKKLIFITDMKTHIQILAVDKTLFDVSTIFFFLGGRRGGSDFYKFGSHLFFLVFYVTAYI